MTETISREQEYQALRSFMKLASDRSMTNTAEQVRYAIEDALTPRQLQMVEMYYLRQMTMESIAAELGVYPSTVSRTLARGRQRLFRCLKYGGRNLTYLLDN